MIDAKRQKWLTNMEFRTVTVTEVREHLAELKPEYSELLELLMNRVVSECPHLELLAARGFGNWVFHIKTPGADPLCVQAAVHPQKQNGIRIMVRRPLLGYKSNADSQLKWKAQVRKSEDIDIVLKYLGGLA